MSMPVTRSKSGQLPPSPLRRFNNLHEHRVKSTSSPSSSFEGLQLPHSAKELQDTPPTPEVNPAEDTIAETMAPVSIEDRKERIKDLATRILMSKGCIPDDVAMTQIIEAHAKIIADTANNPTIDMNYLSAFSQGWVLSQRRYADMALDNLRKSIEPLVSTLAVTATSIKNASESLTASTKSLKTKIKPISFKRSGPQEIARRLSRIRQSSKSTDDMMDPASSKQIEPEESEEEEDEIFVSYSTEVLKETWESFSDDERTKLFVNFVKAATGIDDYNSLPDSKIELYRKSVKGYQMVTAFLMKQDGIDKAKVLRYIKTVWEEDGLSGQSAMDI